MQGEEDWGGRMNHPEQQANINIWHFLCKLITSILQIVWMTYGMSY